MALVDYSWREPIEEIIGDRGDLRVPPIDVLRSLPEAQLYAPTLVYEEAVGLLLRLDTKARASQMKKNTRRLTLTLTDWMVVGITAISFAASILSTLLTAALISQKIYAYAIPAGFAVIVFAMFGALNVAFLRARSLQKTGR